MSPKKFVSISFLVLSVFVILISCSHYKMGKKISLTSSNGSDESHNNGKNCMNCHTTGQEGYGWFNIGGSVYKADKVSRYPNGKILLFTDTMGTGQLKYTLEVDGEGNFYTTNAIDFGKGLYPAHQNTQGLIQYMQTPIISGQCQSCHNVTIDKIWNY